MTKTHHWLIPTLLVALAISACGKKEEAQTAAPAQPATEVSKPAETVKADDNAAGDEQTAKGEKIFKNTCAMCHQTGAAGAPLLGSKEEWAPRIAQGNATLYDHAIKGFTGAKGMMPAKGGNPSLSDEDIQAAVDYMVGKGQ